MNQSINNWDEFWEPVEKSSLFGKFLEIFRYIFWVRNFVNVAFDFSLKGNTLEAGCGSAMPSMILRKKRGDNVAVLDNSNVAINIVRKISKSKRINLIIIKGDMRRIPFRDKSFDLVWNSGTLEHFSDPVPIIAEMKRVGKKTIIIIPLWSLGFKILNFFTLILKNIRNSFFDGNEIWYSPDDFKMICIKAGLEEVVVKEIKCFYFFKYLAVSGK